LDLLLKLGKFREDCFEWCRKIPPAKKASVDPLEGVLAGGWGEVVCRIGQGVVLVGEA
jgi:hypothetical protein